MEWSRPYPIEFSLAVGLGLAGLLMLAWRVARSPDARSLVIVALRSSALVILILILLDPIRKVDTKIPGERPTAIYLIDGSRSMGLEHPSSRIDRVGKLQKEAEASLNLEQTPRIDRYRFGRTLAALSAGEATRAIDDESNLREALERLPSRFGETPPFGVFVFSDGRSSDRNSFEAVAKGYKKLGVPIHVLPIGDPEISGDVAIRDLVVPREAPRGSKIKVKVLVGSHGFEGKRVEVEIRPTTGSDRRPLAKLPLTLVEGDQPTELVIEADRARSPMLVQVLPLPGEAVVENNTVPFQIAARNNKIRVIYMEGSLSPEFAFIRDALVENPDIECLAMTVDAQSTFQPRLYRVDDPSKGYPTTREELLSYDVILCSDIARSAFTPQQLEWTIELVAKRGGGFGMIGGHTSFGSGGWDRTSWDGMIPIDMSGNGPGQSSQFYNGDFQVLVPPDVVNHPIWRIVDNPDKNREIIARMPPFHGTNLTDRLKPAATLLGLSDRPIGGASNIMLPQGAIQTTKQPRRTPSPIGSPIFSIQPYGRGRSFAMSTDSTYAWGSDFETSWGEGDNRYFRKFWRNVVTWLAENSAGSARRLEVSTDKIVYRPGQPILISATAFDDKLEPTDRYQLVTRLIRANPKGSANDPPSPPLVADSPLTPRPSTRDFAGSLPVPSAELIRQDHGSALQMATVEVVALDGDRSVSKASLDVQLLDDSEEFRDPRPDPDRLIALAGQTGGKVLKNADDLVKLLDHSSKAGDRVVTSKAPTWDQPWVLSVLFLLLAAEWIVRRAKGLA
jgi:hypothetical protein